MKRFSFGMMLLVLLAGPIACTQQARPLTEDTQKSIRAVRITIEGGQMENFSRVAGGGGPFSSRSPQEIAAATLALRAGFDAADIGSVLRQQLARHAAIASPVVLILDGTRLGPPGGDAPLPEHSHQLYIRYVAALKTVGGLVPDTYPHILTNARFLNADGITVRSNKWNWCGKVLDFTAVTGDGGRALAGELQRGVALLAEAVLYDTFAAERGRPAGGMGMYAGCTDLDDLPSKRS